MPGPAKDTKKIDVKSAVIKVLAESGPLKNPNEIKKRKNLNYSSIRKAVATLRSEGLIQTAKGGPARIELTFQGFVIYLSQYTLQEVTPPSSWVMTEQQIQKRYREETTELSEEIKRLIQYVESNGERLGYPIFKEVRWLVNINRAVIWDILETARFLSINPPFTSNAIILFKQTQDGIKRLEHEKQSLNDPILRRAFSGGNQYNPFEIVDKQLEYARQYLTALLQSKDKMWCREFAKYFAFKSQYLTGKSDLRNENLAVFFNRIAEDSKRLEVDPAQRLAEAFRVALAPTEG